MTASAEIGLFWSKPLKANTIICGESVDGRLRAGKELQSIVLAYTVLGRRRF